MTIVSKERRARVFRNGRSRAVRIPSEFALDVDEVLLRQEADGLITMRPLKTAGLLALLASMEPLPPEHRLPEINDDDLAPLRDIDV